MKQLQGNVELRPCILSVQEVNSLNLLTVPYRIVIWFPHIALFYSFQKKKTVPVDSHLTHRLTFYSMFKIKVKAKSFTESIDKTYTYNLDEIVDETLTHFDYNRRNL